MVKINNFRTDVKQFDELFSKFIRGNDLLTMYLSDYMLIKTG